MKKVGNCRKLLTLLMIITLGFITFVVPEFAQAHNWASLSGYGTANIDGVLSPGEWENAGVVEVDVRLCSDPTSGCYNKYTVPASFYVMNDEDNLYMAVKVHHVLDDIRFFIAFDNDHDAGFREDGDDVLYAYTSNLLLDYVFFRQGGYKPDTFYGGTNDGEVADSDDDTSTILELSHPLDSADDAHDINLTLGKTVGFDMTVTVYENDWGISNGFYRGDVTMVSSAIPDVTNVDKLKSRRIELFDQTQMPVNLVGGPPSARVTILPVKSEPYRSYFDATRYPPTVPYAKLKTSGNWCYKWNPNAFFSLYAQTAYFGRVKLHQFNPSCEGGANEIAFYLPFNDDAWFTEPLILEIYTEEDDGIDEPDTMEPRLLLRGED